MNRKRAILFIAVLMLGALNAQPQTTAAHKSVWSGVYSDEQASRGQATYEQYCVNCHGETLGGGPSSGGPQLAGDKFMENWREDTVETLFLKIRNTMPRPGFRGSDKVLTDPEAADLVAFIFKRNGFPAGAELMNSAISDVWIEQQSGPKPLPNYAQVQVVGCMEQEAENWVLAKAPQPARIRTTSETIEPEVLKSAQGKPAGSLKFRLQNLLMLGAFSPEAHKGHKMLAQGVLIRQSNIERISVTKLEMVAATCAP